MSKLVLRIDREIGGYALFKSLKELGECLQEQDAYGSTFDTEEEYYEANGRISSLSELTDTEKLIVTGKHSPNSFKLLNKA